MSYPDYHEGKRHKYGWYLFDMGDGIYKECDLCGFIPKRDNKEYWDFVKSGRVSCIVLTPMKEPDANLRI